MHAISSTSSSRSSRFQQSLAFLWLLVLVVVVAAATSAVNVHAASTDQGKHLFFRLKADAYTVYLQIRILTGTSTVAAEDAPWYATGLLLVKVKNYDAVEVVHFPNATAARTIVDAKNVTPNMIRTLPFDPSVENSFNFLDQRLATDVAYDERYGFPTDARIAFTANTTIQFGFGNISVLEVNKDRQRLQAMYDAAWKLWRDKGDFANYQYRTRTTCFCPESSMTERIVSVSHGKVVNARLSSDNQPVSTRGYSSISAIFVSLQWGIDAGYVPTFQANYDTELGYPKQYSFHIGRVAMSDVPGYKIYNLQEGSYNAPKSKSYLLIVGIVVGVVLLCFVIGFSIYLHRKSITGTSSPAGRAQDQQSGGVIAQSGKPSGSQRASYYLSGTNVAGVEDSKNDGADVYSNSDEDTVIDHGEDAPSDSFDNNNNEIEMKHGA